MKPERFKAIWDGFKEGEKKLQSIIDATFDEMFYAYRKGDEKLGDRYSEIATEECKMLAEFRQDFWKAIYLLEVTERRSRRFKNEY